MKLIDFLDLISDAEFLVIVFDASDVFNGYLFMGHKDELTIDFTEVNPDLNVIHVMPAVGFEEYGLVLEVE